MYISRVEKILKGFSKNLSVHNSSFHHIFVFILIKNQFITHISSIKSLLLYLYKILFHSLYRQKLSFKLYRCYHSAYIRRNTHKNMTTYFTYSFEPQFRQFMGIFQNTEKPLNYCSFIICLFKRFTLSD